MSTIGWILLIALFVGAHLLMHRGHGAHGAHGSQGARGAGSRTPQDGHQHDTEGDSAGDSEAAPTGEAARHTHRGC